MTKLGFMQYDPEYLPISLLSQANYCMRRAALILNEQIWVESADTAKGRAEHERTHTQRTERRGDQIKLYEYAVFSDTLGLSGKCDCVELTRSNFGCSIPAADFFVALYPVEYKHGSVRDESEYKIQLCAQAMCLEEMYGAKIAEGAIYFITAHRRLTVALTNELRARVRETAEAVRSIRAGLSIPKPDFSEKCKRCSLMEYCMPKIKQTADEYCRRLAMEVVMRDMP